MSKKCMKVLFSHNKLLNLKSIDLDFYEECMYEKQKRASFLKMGVRVKPKKLELIHTTSLDYEECCESGEEARLIVINLQVENCYMVELDLIKFWR